MADRRPSSRGSRPGTPGASSRPRGGPSRPQRPTARPARASVPGRAAGGVRARPRFTGRAAVLVLVLAVLMVSYASSMRAYLEQRSHLESLHAQIAESEANIEALEREKERWDDPAYVRAQARERFGWVLPGEIGFQVIDEDGEALDHDDSLPEPVTTDEAEQPLWWQAAWDSVEAAGNPEDVEERPAPIERIRAPKQPARR
jgi:cell division protein FtsB